jgi:S-DNA-T family DNA segregation ATPase FtsK/SpoIIIE
LPDLVDAADLDHDGSDEPGRTIAVGVFDAPERQEQGVATIDLERSGGLAVFGSGGTGKTTVLRTIAAGVERAGAVSIVFDFASRGLVSLRSLPSVIDVATGDDLEAVTRHLVVLDEELRHRRALLVASGAEHLTAHHRAGGDRLDRIVILIDGLGSLADVLLDPLATGPGCNAWSDLVHRLVVDGRQVGIHVVVTADRRSAIPSRLQSAIGSRLVLHQADPQSYADLGVAADRAAGLADIEGRALLDGVTVQVAVEGDDPSARGQAAAISHVAGRRGAPASSAARLRSSALPERTSDGGFAVADVTGQSIRLDVEWSHAAIVGPGRSGRSTALAAALTALEMPECYVVGPATSPLAALGLPASRSRFGRPAVVAELLGRLADRLVGVLPDERVALLVDDVDALDDPVLEPLWTQLLDHGAVRLIATMDTRSMSGYTTSSVVNELRRSRRLLVLRPDDSTEFLQLTGSKLCLRPGLRLVPGRGVLLVDQQPATVQVVDALAGQTARTVGNRAAAS